MRACTIALVLTVFTVTIQAAQLDTNSMVGTFVFDSKKVNEAKAVSIGENLSKIKSTKRILVRQFKDANTWAIDLVLQHDGTKKGFPNAVKEVEDTILSKHGDVLQKKYVASSVTWVKK